MNQPLPDELDEILHKIMYGHKWTEGNGSEFLKAKSALQAYTNRAVLSVLGRVEREVIGDNDKQDWDEDSDFCDNCDFEPSDGTKHCICFYRNRFRLMQRGRLSKISKEYLGGDRDD